MLKKTIRTILSFVVVVVLWQTACTLAHTNETLFPSPYKVLQAFIQLCTTGLPGSTSSVILPLHIETSLIRFAIGYWFGIGDVPAIVIIFIAGFFPILLSVVSAVQNVDKIYYKIADSFGVNKVKTLFCIIFPAIFTQISNALRLALGTSWIFLVSGEMVGSQSGLGFLIMDTKNCMRFDSLLATMLTIGVIGFILDGFLRIAEKLIRTKFGFGA